MSDGMTVNDAISRIEMKSIFDDVGVVDSISTSISYGRNMQDLIGVDDSQTISITYRKAISDGISTTDSIQLKGLLNIETRDKNDNLIALATTYRIIPDPATGTGWMDVADGD